MSKIAFVTLYEANYLGTRVLSSYLNAHGHDVHNILFKDFHWVTKDVPIDNKYGYQSFTNFNISTCNYDHELWTEKEAGLLEQRLRELQPDIIGVSSRSPLTGLVKKLMPHIRKGAPAALLVAGGFGPTLEPGQYLDMGFDAVIRGDGEETFLELANAVDKKENWKSMPNLAWQEKGRVNINPLRGQTKNISSFPAPDYTESHFTYIDSDTINREIDPLYMHNVDLPSQGLYNTFISRGCVKHCSYCSGGHWSSLYKDDGAKTYKTRKRDLNVVLEELEKIDKKNFFHVNFVDECNVLTSDEIRYFYPEYKKRIGLPFTSYLNYPKMVANPELFNIIVDSGLALTGVGVQTGSEKFALKYYMRKNDNSVYQPYLKMLYDAYITTDIHFIPGNSYEEMDHLEETLNLIKTFPFSLLDPSRIRLRIQKLKVFPYSPLREICPKILSMPMSLNEWHRRSLLMHIRQFATDEEMEYAKGNIQFAKDAKLLLSYGKELLHQKQREYMNTLIPELKRQNIVFFGGGDIFYKHWSYFKTNSLFPKAIIMDLTFKQYYPKFIKNIPVYDIEEFGDDIYSSKIIVFAKKPSRIIRNLISKYKIKKENVMAFRPNKSLLA